MAKAVRKIGKPKNGYKMPDPIPEGTILTDINKNQWRVGKSIGKGGFGEIYLAKDASKPSDYNYVIKVEPHTNGPLFVEMHFYMKNAKKEEIETFMKKHKLKTFGMPVFIGAGSHEIGKTKYRFIVMEKFAKDIDKILKEHNGALPPATVFRLGYQLVYVLEYIHGLGYVHADIKGGNVLMGATKETENQAYLVDFGLATKFTIQKEFKPNPKKAHDGTIEYLSRDAHHGVPTMRGDLEILGYNLINWLGGKLPWDSQLQDPNVVHKLKEENMNDIPKFIKTAVNNSEDTLIKFLEYVNSLSHTEVPNYSKVLTLFQREIKKNGSTVNAPFDFSNNSRKRSHSVGGVEEIKTVGKQTKKGKENEVQSADEETVPKNKKKAVGRKKVVKQPGKKEQGTEELMTDAMKEVLAKKAERQMKQKKPTTSRKKAKRDAQNGVENDEMKEIRMRLERENNITVREKRVVRKSPRLHSMTD